MASSGVYFSIFFVFLFVVLIIGVAYWYYYYRGGGATGQTGYTGPSSFVSSLLLTTNICPNGYAAANGDNMGKNIPLNQTGSQPPNIYLCIQRTHDPSQALTGVYVNQAPITAPICGQTGYTGIGFNGNYNINSGCTPAFQTNICTTNAPTDPNTGSGGVPITDMYVLDNILTGCQDNYEIVENVCAAQIPICSDSVLNSVCEVPNGSVVLCVSYTNPDS